MMNPTKHRRGKNPNSRKALELSRMGRNKLSEEHKRKISENHANVSGVNNPFYGKKHSLETIKKQSKIHKELYKKRPELKKQISISLTGRHHSLETRKKRSIANSKEKHWNWQGGKSIANKKRVYTIEYREWRKSVFERDDYTCQLCGARSKKDFIVILNADHIKPWAYFPLLRFDINNGRTLCVDCHKKTPTFAGRAKKIIYE